MPIKNEGTYPRISTLSFEFGKEFLLEATRFCSEVIRPYVEDPYFTDLKFEFQLQNDKKLLHRARGCWRSPGYLVRLNIEEIASSNFCEFCAGDTLIASNSSFIRKLVAAAAIFLAISDDDGSKDPASLENPLRIPSISDSISNLIDDLDLLHHSGYTLGPAEASLIKMMKSQLRYLGRKLENFSSSDAARMQLSRNVLNLKPGAELPLSTTKEHFIAITKDHVESFDWATRFSNGYIKAFKVEVPESSKFYLFKAPLEVIKVMCELFVVDSNASAEVLPGDTAEVIETALGVMTRNGDGPLSTTQGAFSTARALQD